MLDVESFYIMLRSKGGIHVGALYLGRMRIIRVGVI